MLLACQAICARFCMTSSKQCSSVSQHDILDCSRTQYTTYAEFFTEVTGDEWDCATVCWHTVHVPGPLPSSREPGASTCNVFRRIHTAHVQPERVMLTREANVWKRWNFLTFLPCFEYRITGQTAAHSAGNMLRKKNFHPLVCFCATLDYHVQIAQCAPPNLSLIHNKIIHKIIIFLTVNHKKYRQSINGTILKKHSIIRWLQIID